MYHIKEIQYLNISNNFEGTQTAVFAITECGRVFKKRTASSEESDAWGKVLTCRTFANVPFVPTVVKRDAVYEQLDYWVDVTDEQIDD